MRRYNPEIHIINIDKYDESLFYFTYCIITSK